MAKRKILLILLLVVPFSMALAQPGGGPGGGGDPAHGRPVPISGIEILLLAGGIMGVRHRMKSVSKK